MHGSRRNRGWRVIALAMVAAVAVASVASAQGGDDPLQPRQWHLERITAPDAWDSSRGDGVLVAVLDSGVHANHEDLQGKVAPGVDLVDDDGDASDSNGRGTQVAGIVAAVTGNGIGIASVAPDAQILPVRVVDDAGRSTEERIADGIRYAVDEAERRRLPLVVTLSLADVPAPPDAGLTPASPDDDQPVTDAVRDAWTAGALVVIAWRAGAEVRAGDVDTYALKVGATDRNDRPTVYSGQEPDVVAPGEGIVTTTYDPNRPDDHSAYTCNDESCTRGTASGTTLAAGHGAGVGALLMAQGFTNDTVMRRIRDTARATDDSGCGSRDGCGIVDANQATDPSDPAVRSDARTRPDHTEPTPAATPTTAPTAPPTAEPDVAAVAAGAAATPAPTPGVPPAGQEPRVRAQDDADDPMPRPYAALAAWVVVLVAAAAATRRWRPAPAVTSAHPHVPALDGLRGLAVLAVIGYHAFAILNSNAPWLGESSPPVYLWPLSVAFLGVDIFFVLSGFLLIRSWMSSRSRSEGLGGGVRDYGRRRAVRILPVYWVMLAILIPLTASAVLSSPRKLAMFATVNQYLDPELPWEVNGVTWSLTTEIHFYLLVPVLTLLVLRLGWGRTLVGLLAASVAWRVAFWPAGGVAEWIVGRADQFVVGMAAAVVVARHRAGLPSYASRLLTMRWAGGVIWIAFGVVASLHASRYWLEKPAWLEIALHPVTGLAVGALIVRGLCRGQMGVLSQPWLRWVGLISYSLYLWHWPIMRIAIDRGWQPGWGGAPALGGLVAAAFAVSAASFYLVERPALRLKPRSSRVRDDRAPSEEERTREPSAQRP